MALELVPFTADLIADAAALLAARHQRDRAVLPELPPQFENRDAACAALRAAWQLPHTSGGAALENGRLVGYLFGDMNFDVLRGRHVWIRQAGHALAADVSAELYADLYAFAGPRWVDWGCFDHFILIPPSDPLVVEVWFGLCLGREQVYAIRQLSDDDMAVSIPAGDFTVRRATPEDRAIMAEVSPWIARHLVTAPVWGVSMPEDLAEMRAGYAELVDDPSVTVWLALRGEQVLGMAGFFPAETAPDDMLTPPSCTKLSVVATHELARGSGVGLALTLHGLAQARASGHAWCLADWRSTNLLASRFFPRRGFRPVLYRLARKVDPRIVWANARRS